MPIKFGDVYPLKLYLEEKKRPCLICDYYTVENGCDRIFKQTKGRMKIDIPDPLDRTCEAFQPIFRCEECKFFVETKGDFGSSYACTKTQKTGDDIALCGEYIPNDEKKAKLEEIYKDSGFPLTIEE